MRNFASKTRSFTVYCCPVIGGRLLVGDFCNKIAQADIRGDFGVPTDPINLPKSINRQRLFSARKRHESVPVRHFHFSQRLRVHRVVVCYDSMRFSKAASGTNAKCVLIGQSLPLSTRAVVVPHGLIDAMKSGHMILIQGSRLQSPYNQISLENSRMNIERVEGTREHVRPHYKAPHASGGV
jgi:hypothetical protein